MRTQKLHREARCPRPHHQPVADTGLECPSPAQRAPRCSPPPPTTHLAARACWKTVCSRRGALGPKPPARTGSPARHPACRAGASAGPPSVVLPGRGSLSRGGGELPQKPPGWSGAGQRHVVGCGGADLSWLLLVPRAWPEQELQTHRVGPPPDPHHRGHGFPFYQGEHQGERRSLRALPARTSAAPDPRVSAPASQPL